MRPRRRWRTESALPADRLPPDGRLRRRDEPVDTARIYALASVPTYNQVAAANDPDLQRDALHRSARPARRPRDRRRVSDRLDVQADHRRGRRSRSDSSLRTRHCSAAGSFNLGGFVFHNVEAGVFESMTLHDGARAVVRHVVLPARRPRLREPTRASRASLIQQWARKFGLGARPPPIDLTGDRAGLRARRRARRSRSCMGFPWTEGQTINLAIGQGALQVSPLQLAVVYSAIANGGTVVRPHVADAVVRGGRRKAALQAAAQAEARRRRRDPTGPVRGSARRDVCGGLLERTRSRSPARPARRRRRPATTTRGTRPGRRPGATPRSSSCA